MKGHLILLMSCISLACGCAQQNKVKKEVDIFNKQDVVGLATADAKQQQRSQAEYDKGIQLLRRQQKAGDAIPHFRESILHNPTARAYFELGNSYASVKDFHNALHCYQFAEQLGFSPLSRVLYNTACAYSLMDSVDKASDYLEYAIQAGYLNKRQIENDDDLAKLRESYSGKYAIISGFEGVDNPLNVLWSSFVSLFRPMVLPAGLVDVPHDADPICEYIGYEYERFVPEMQKREKFSRGDGYEYRTRGIVEQNKNFIVLVYSESYDAEMVEAGSGRYFLASYNPSGKLIDKMLIVGQTRMEDPYQSCVINNNLTFQVVSVMNKYKEDVDSNRIKHWSLVSSEPAGTRYFKIGDDGHFTETGATLGGESLKAPNGDLASASPHHGAAKFQQ